jgi:predicted amidophosphoribosyltransferase
VPQLTVEEASTAYVRAMRNVPPVRDGICAICKTFISVDYSRCYQCGHQPHRLDVVAPITYSENLGQMHLALRSYKDGVPAVRNYAMPRLAGILWRYLETHEECIARASGTDTFDVVTTVPSSTPEADEARTGLRTIVGWCDPVNDRYERVLRATGEAPPSRAYSEDRYMATRRMDGERVLLVDDTWTAGGHAQSAGYSLRVAGAVIVGLVVIGRHLNPEWEVTPGVSSAELFTVH